MNQKICYLCGEPLDRERSRDHVPPKQFFATRIRKARSLNLIVLPVHKSCNNAYQHDEDYFLHSIAPLAGDSVSGSALWHDMRARTQKDEHGRQLAQMVFKEFDERPGGIHLPAGRIAKRYDGKRIHRVIWKSIRGLFYYETDRFLPESTPHGVKMPSVGERPPDEFFLLNDAPLKGEYGGIFDYKYASFPEANDRHLYAMLLWDRIIVLVYFHDPECECDICSPDKTPADTQPATQLI